VRYRCGSEISLWKWDIVVEVRYRCGSEISLWKWDIVVEVRHNKRVWKFSLLYFYLNKTTNQTKHQGRFYRAFINYINKTFIRCVFIKMLLLGAPQAQQTFLKASQRRKFEKHWKMQLEQFLRKSVVLNLGSIEPLGFDRAISGVRRRSSDFSKPIFSFCYIGLKWGSTKAWKTT